MSEPKIKGKNGSYFHNNILISRESDRERKIGLIDAQATDDIICRLNGYAVIPIEEYYNLRGDPTPSNTLDNINSMNKKLEATDE